VRERHWWWCQDGYLFGLVIGRGDGPADHRLTGPASSHTATIGSHGLEDQFVAYYVPNVLTSPFLRAGYLRRKFVLFAAPLRDGRHITWIES
jgi:hypothetical protein